MKCLARKADVRERMATSTRKRKYGEVDVSEMTVCNSATVFIGEVLPVKHSRCHRKSNPGLYRSGRIGYASGINPSDRIR